MDILAQSWLSQQCKIIHGVSSGVVMLGVPDKGGFTPVACWPDNDTASPELLAAARQASEKHCMVVNKAKTDDGFDAIACPLVKHNKLIGIVAVELSHRPEAQQRGVIQLLKWGVTWLEMLIEQESRSSQKYLSARMSGRLRSELLTMNPHSTLVNAVKTVGSRIRRSQVITVALAG